MAPIHYPNTDSHLDSLQWKLKRKIVIWNAINISNDITKHCSFTYLHISQSTLEVSWGFVTFRWLHDYIKSSTIRKCFETMARWPSTVVCAQSAGRLMTISFSHMYTGSALEGLSSCIRHEEWHRISQWNIHHYKNPKWSHLIRVTAKM